MDLRKIIQPASVALALMASSFTPGVVRADIEGVVVHFNAGMTPPSPLRLRNAEKQGREPRQFPAEKLKGYLYKSKSNEAGIVLAPGCLGVKQFHHAWARRLADWGYTALIVDSAGSRGMNQNCAGEHLLGFREAALDRRVYDVFGAHEFLTTGKGVNPKRIALMGWGYADTLAAVLETGVQRFFNASFAAAVAYYPSCRTAPTGRFVAPLLLLIGAK
ncbi:MAG: hypothetical protein HN889_11365, partial [Rhodospirillaceae bacterium]|nr:hypothetical protein [Rhodospirillaceae bacterium]